MKRDAFGRTLLDRAIDRVLEEVYHRGREVAAAAGMALMRRRAPGWRVQD